MNHHHQTKTNATIVVIFMVTLMSCEASIGPREDNCGVQGKTQKCICVDDKEGVQSCDGSGLWSPCECQDDVGDVLDATSDPDGDVSDVSVDEFLTDTAPDMVESSYFMEFSEATAGMRLEVQVAGGDGEQTLLRIVASRGTQIPGLRVNKNETHYILLSATEPPYQDLHLRVFASVRCVDNTSHVQPIITIQEQEVSADAPPVKFTIEPTLWPVIPECD